ncbi:RNA polymerase sigma factor [Streptomyces sp. NPDC001480]|uniref:RNA polymerase sigma factor n=1 Tax=Streptomyces sp. NPDC001480 TaxID=3364577 RepID=UPI003675EED8
MNGTSQLRDASDWEEVFEQHGQRLLRLARGMLWREGVPASALDAEDLVQTAFCRVVRYPAEVLNKPGYLYTVIKHLVVGAAEQYRKTQRPEVLARWLERGSEPDFSDQVGIRFDVQEALEKLPARQREAVWNTKALGKTQQETAEQMGVAPGSVAAHTKRALNHLRKTLALRMRLSVIGVLSALTGAVSAVHGWSAQSIAFGVISVALLLGVLGSMARQRFWEWVYDETPQDPDYRMLADAIDAGVVGEGAGLETAVLTLLGIHGERHQDVLLQAAENGLVKQDSSGLWSVHTRLHERRLEAEAQRAVSMA